MQLQDGFVYDHAASPVPTLNPGLINISVLLPSISIVTGPPAQGASVEHRLQREVIKHWLWEAAYGYGRFG